MKTWKKAFTTSLLTGVMASSALAANYCAGVRGNGELAPAHWSGLSRVVENKGLPEAMAGGSSAAITLFFMDAISRNQGKTKEEQALMLKSLIVHLYYLYEVDAKSPVIMRTIGNVTGMGDGGFMHKLKSALKIAKDLPTLLNILGEYGPLLNPKLVKGLREDFSFYKSQLKEAVSVFGSFDAKTDKNLFYREGIVDFKYLAVLFGRVADFYAGYGNDKANSRMDNFLAQCSNFAVGKEWKEMAAARPECHGMFYSALDAYYEDPTEMRWRTRGRRRVQVPVTVKRKFPNKMVFEQVGSGLNVFPTTALVVNGAADRYRDRIQEYNDQQAVGVEDFSLDFETELKYGYWGRKDALSNVASQLKTQYPNDTKSNKFQAIENGIWFEVLATSPAEPGLSNLQRIPRGEDINPNSVIFKKYFKKKWYIFPTLKPITWFNEKNNKGVIPFREDMYSAGGWSDLHPTIVLKANGCDDVMYVTRQDGESVFGQQVFIRLTGYTDKISFWEDIAEGNRRGWTELTEVEANSPWNRLYNLANPNSSFNNSIRALDTVYCTDWNAYNVFKPGQLDLLQTDAYNAPLFVKDESRRSEYNFGLEFEGKSPDNFPGCILKDFN